MRLIDQIDVDPTSAFAAVTRLYKLDCYAFGSHDWFLHKYSTEKLSRVIGSAAMVRKLAGGTKKKVAETESIRPVYCEEFSTRSMLFDFAKRLGCNTRKRT